MQNQFLNYAVSFFNKLNLGNHVVNINEPLSDEIDLGLRRAILQPTSVSVTQFEGIDPHFTDNHIIYMLSDMYECHYILIPVPNQELETSLYIGPYLTEISGVYRTTEICDKLGIPSSLHSFINQYLATIPCLRDSSVIEAFLETLGENVYGIGNFRIEYLKQPVKGDTDYLTAMDNNNYEDIMQRLEYRYGLEEKVIDSISRGDFNSAMKYSTDQALSNIDNRSTSTLRSKKNNLLAFNTICRKGAERGNVHPIHLDEMSRRMAIKIENMTSPNQDKDIHREILKKYCTMVQHNSTTGYSATMQKVLNHIMQNLTNTELTLQSTAASLGLNKSYLATLFKKETSKTFTGYVNFKRLEHAIFLLNATDLQIQEVANSCGIPDVTYFTRIFRQEKGMTPTQYRKMINQ
ncbi:MULTISPECIES: helix-turn-helix domain-containing protein [unclassified Butyrivibrio]|uniref:helix-turn-helix domain-containing protein n=1 Tax=unclassified Butyrivibrio TaxID=2639466 RepID=UPI0004237238|nr:MULTISPECIES: helix-turn-helix domain-containing protein [unclassified Butyrivibrio]